MKKYCLLLFLVILSGCQSQPTKPINLAPAKLAVFQKEQVWLDTNATSTHNEQTFNNKLKTRLALYGAEDIRTLGSSQSPKTGQVIQSRVIPFNGRQRYQMRISRNQRELISADYPISSTNSDQLAINDFLSSIHHKIINADQYF
ncbi:hypothetical protein [Neptuniibacter sp. QD37_11]|uniref:hypothetical protein n=1 Tax=Neptuniibacter sp. QD37_11 TaxID=3398209 RepID=UPI0039F60616